MALISVITEEYYLLPILLLPLLYYVIKSFSAPKDILPPGPTPWPLVGNLLQMTKLPLLEILSQFAQKHGPLILVRLGTQNLVVGTSPEAAKQILRTQDRILSARYVPMTVPGKREKLNKIAMSWNDTCNDTWKSLRQVCRTELFSGKNLDAKSYLREKKVTEMMKYLKGKSETGETVEIREVVYSCVFNILSNLLLSKDVIGIDEESDFGGGGKAAAKVLREVSGGVNISDFYPILSKLDLQGLRKKAEKLIMNSQAVCEPIIQERRNAGTNLRHNDFLDVLLLNNFTDERIHQLFSELFTAAGDTSASVLEFAIAELMRNPECMKRVLQELDEEFGLNSLNESRLLQLPYLNACIRETLRLHPPTPLLGPHRASEPCQVMNCTIPKNARVAVNIWAIGRDPAIWEEPLKFKPERFLNSTIDFKGNDFELLPFGSGRRICPGLPLASRTIPLVLAYLIHSFQWSLPNHPGAGGNNISLEIDMTETYGGTLLKKQPLLCIIKPRN